MSADAPQLSVVIPTYNRADILMTSLARLDAEDSSAEFEIIVVSDGSTDETTDRLNEWQPRRSFRWAQQANQGAAAARNHGATLAKGPVLLFLDDDMRATPGLVDAHLARFKAGADVVVGRIGHDTTSPRTILSRYVERWSAEFHQQLADHGVQEYSQVLSGHLAISAATFAELGGFDEDFTDDGRYGNEDLEFALRLMDSGATVVYGNDAQADQFYAVTASARLQQARDLARADALLADRSEDGARLFEQRKVGPGKVENAVLDSISRQSPTIAWTVAWPLRLITEKLVDDGRTHRLVHQWFGVHQGLAYRLGLADVGVTLDAQSPG